jgi:hypothetical protein
MYSLTLTADERRAFDWVGDRYNSGKVAELLMDCFPDDREWDDDGAITFQIPEHVAWEIKELAPRFDRASNLTPDSPLSSLAVGREPP